MANKTKNNRSSDHRSSPANNSGNASDGVIVETPTSNDGDPLASADTNNMTPRQASLLNSFEALGLKEQFELLEKFSLMKKLEGKLSFTDKDQEEIKAHQLDTGILDDSKAHLSFLETEGDRKPAAFPFSDGTGFRPNATSFRPKETKETHLKKTTQQTDLDPDGYRSSYYGDEYQTHHGVSSNPSLRMGHSTTLPYQPPSPHNNTKQPYNTAPSSSTTGKAATSGFNGGIPAASPNQHQFQPQPSHPQNHHHFQHHQHSAGPSQQHHQSTNHYHHHQAYQPASHHNQFNPNFQQQQHSTANRMPQGTPHGFMLRAVPRTAAQADYDNDRVIVSRKDRGNTVKERAKIREICTTAITPQITRSNITKLLTNDSKTYDVAEDASQWQTTLRAIYRHVVASDFKHIVMIPLHFDEHDPTTINASTQYINAVLDHDKLTDEHYKSFQRFLRRYGRDEELTSDNWFEEKLWKSLGPALLSEVSSDFLELDKDVDLSKPNTETCKGSLTLLRLIINRVVQSNQESRRALEEYIKTFDIRRFPGEDVTAASLRIKAVARSIGVDNLPSDIIHRVLEGFSHASTPMFQSFCATQEALITSSLIRDRLRNKQTLYKMLVDILTDLEVRYTDLRSGQRWLGHGHGNSAVDSAFVMGTAHDYHHTEETSDDDDDYAVYLNRVGRKEAVPFNVWVRDKKCHNCGEVGHVRPQCPHRSHAPVRRDNHRYQRDSSGHSKPYERGSKPTSQRLSPSDQRLTSKARFNDNGKQYAKKVLTAALEMVDADDATLDHEIESSADTTAPETADPSLDSGSKYSAFLAALGCPPKE